jgi:hypothetical protein
VGDGFSRRSILLSGAAALAQAGLSHDWAGALRTRAAGPGLLQSYEVTGTSAFDLTQAHCAYVYDNAVAGLALLAAGDTRAASGLGDALLAAQSGDRFWHDGRLRNAYRAGPVRAGASYPLAGWWDAGQGRWLEDPYQAGTATGVVAWAMLLWIGLHRATGTPAYRQGAERAADWVERSVPARRGYQGGFLGFEPAPQPLTWVSTEHNIDLAAAFAALGRMQAAAHARDFVASMWNPAQGRFFTGLRPDGSVNDHSAVDANLWPLLAAGADQAWHAALDWILAKHGVHPAAGDGAPREGIDFNTDRDGIWLEGTAITALACRRLGKQGAASRLMDTLASQTAPSGLIYACTTPTLTTGLSTGLDANAPDFIYFRRPHIAPTAWAVLAQLNLDPFPANS